MYVNDMVVKSSNTNDHPKYSAKVFTKLRKHNMRLNPEKCTFRFGRGKLLGFMITDRGIKANPDKCEALIAMRTYKLLK